LKAEAEALKRNQKKQEKPENRFSLFRTANCLLNNHPIEDADAEVLMRGQNEMLKSGCHCLGQIQLPVGNYEQRATIQATVAGQGIEIVQEEKQQLIGPLYN
jgi:hypothetical protein